MTITAITVPKWGIEMQEATLAEWKLHVGASVNKGDELLDMETEKILNTVEAAGDGVLRQQIGQPGDVYCVGALLGVIASADVSDEDVAAFAASFVPVDASFDGADADSDNAPTPTPKSAPTVAQTSGEVRISPIAKRLAEQLGVDWSGIVGTGRNGRISKQDVERAAAALSSGQPLVRSATQKTVAARMQAAKQQVPHFYLDIDVQCDMAQTMRAEYNAANGCKVTLNDVLLCAVSAALRQSPDVNVVLKDDALYAADDALGVAIASDDGLVAPVIRGMSAHTLRSVNAEVKRLAAAATSKSLTANDLGGGATTVSNLGMFGVDGFAAIINPPQTSILAAGRAQPKPVVRDGAVAIAQVMTLRMSCDHRAFDGAAGAKFLATLKLCIEAPEALFA